MGLFFFLKAAGTGGKASEQAEIRLAGFVTILGFERRAALRGGRSREAVQNTFDGCRGQIQWNMANATDFGVLLFGSQY